MSNLILAIIATVIFCSYAIYCQIKYPQLSSYSKGYYELKEEGKKKGKRTEILFQVWVLSLSGIVMIMGKDIPYYIAGGLLSFVAFFPTIKNEKHFIHHLVGAVSSTVGLSIYLTIRYWDADVILIYVCMAAFSVMIQFLVEFFQNVIIQDLKEKPNLIKYLETFVFSYIILMMYIHV